MKVNDPLVKAMTGALLTDKLNLSKAFYTLEKGTKMIFYILGIFNHELGNYDTV